MTLNASETLALGAGALWCVRGVQTLIPRPILAGLAVALCVAAARPFQVEFTFDTVLRDLLITVFFTTVGLRASTSLLKRDGARVGVCLALAVAGAIAQNAVGVWMATLLGLNPLTGIVAGALTLAGGPATALAFGQTFDQAGLPNSQTIGLACAVFGIVASGLLSAGIGEFLVRRHGLRSEGGSANAQAARTGSALDTVGLLVLAVGVGSLLSRAIPVPLPGHIGAMIVAAVIRWTDDRRGQLLDERTLAVISEWSVNLFIVLALVSLKLWVLLDLALPLFAILLVQVLVTCFVAVVLVWWFLGRNYEAAVASAGWTGFMIGTTANAITAISALERRHGPAPGATMTVSVVGAFLIDFTNSFVILTSADFVRRYLVN